MAGRTKDLAAKEMLISFNHHSAYWSISRSDLPARQAVLEGFADQADLLSQAIESLPRVNYPESAFLAGRCQNQYPWQRYFTFMQGKINTDSRGREPKEWRKERSSKFDIAPQSMLYRFLACVCASTSGETIIRSECFLRN